MWILPRCPARNEGDGIAREPVPGWKQLDEKGGGHSAREGHQDAQDDLGARYRQETSGEHPEMERHSQDQVHPEHQGEEPSAAEKDIGEPAGNRCKEYDQRNGDGVEDHGRVHGRGGFYIFFQPRGDEDQGNVENRSVGRGEKRSLKVSLC